MARRRKRERRRKVGERCRYCRDKENQTVDYKDVETMQRLVTGEGSMFGRRRSGCCARHQRQLKIAIMRGRFLALLPYSR